MKVTSITFKLGRTIPLMPLSNDQADQYANARPEASVTIDLTKNDADPAVEAGKKMIDDAFEFAAELCFERLKDFMIDLSQVYKKRDEERAKRAKQGR